MPAVAPTYARHGNHSFVQLLRYPESFGTGALLLRQLLQSDGRLERHQRFQRRRLRVSHPATLDLEIDDQEFAYQFIAGGSKSLTSNIDLFLEYRYFATTEFDLVNNTPLPPVQFGEDAYEANDVFVGFRLFR